MKDEFYKIVSFLAISLVLCWLSDKLSSTFIDEFSLNFISLLTTLLAINIASSSLIAGKLKEISMKTGANFHETSKELKNSLISQIFLIGIAFIVLIVKGSEIIAEYIGRDTLKLISNTVTIGIFIYFLDSIKDIGKALLQLLNYDPPRDEQDSKK